MSAENKPIFSYSMVFHDREFMIEFHRDGVSHWQDWTLKKRLAQNDDARDFIGAAIFSDARAAQRFDDRRKEFTVSVALEREAMSFVEVASDMAATDKWTTAHERRLDRILAPIFWRDVNPQLSLPIERKRSPTRRHSQ